MPLVTTEDHRQDKSRLAVAEESDHNQVFLPNYPPQLNYDLAMPTQQLAVTNNLDPDESRDSMQSDYADSQYSFNSRISVF